MGMFRLWVGRIVAYSGSYGTAMGVRYGYICASNACTELMLETTGMSNGIMRYTELLIPNPTIAISAFFAILAESGKIYSDTLRASYQSVLEWTLQCDYVHAINLIRIGNPSLVRSGKIHRSVEVLGKQRACPYKYHRPL